jgi:hypothetical protein
MFLHLSELLRRVLARSRALGRLTSRQTSAVTDANKRIAQFLDGVASNPRIMLEPDNKIYKLEGNGWSGYVLAGIMRTHEDEGEYAAPSPLIE